MTIVAFLDLLLRYAVEMQMENPVKGEKGDRGRVNTHLYCTFSIKGTPDSLRLLNSRLRMSESL